ncbi:mechanosensitive ion channel [Cognatishimia sp. F0-27]|nr:mechanosensitive ion channel [Cognatishimia sp. F0-27]
MFLALPGLAQDSAQDSAPDDTEITATEQAVDVTPVARDDEIDTRITGILLATDWYEALAVRVEDGIVFLDGRTATEQRALWARDLAAKTSGVVAVVNRIRVDPKVEFTLDPAIDAVEDLQQRALVALPSIILAIVVLPLAWVASGLVRRFARWSLNGRTRSPFLSDLLASIIALPVFLLGLYVVLQAAGLTKLAFSVVGGAGVIGIVIGFAFRDIAENFLASILLSVRQPFKRGDFISVAGQMGLVHSMNTRSTVLVSPSGNHIQIPNASVFKSIIENFTAVPNRREVIDVGIGYDDAVSDAQAIISRILAEQDGVLHTPEPMVLADSLGVSTVNIKVYYWFDGASISPLKLKSLLIQRIKQGLTDAGLSMPADIHELVFPQGIPGVEAKVALGQEKPQAPPRPTTEPAAPREQIAADADEDLKNESDLLEEQLAAPIEGDADHDLLGS